MQFEVKIKRKPSVDWKSFHQMFESYYFCWHNFSPLGKDKYHCHLNYRYVACWTYKQGEIIIEVYYVGTREKAPY